MRAMLIVIAPARKVVDEVAIMTVNTKMTSWNKLLKHLGRALGSCCIDNLAMFAGT